MGPGSKLSDTQCYGFYHPILQDYSLCTKLVSKQINLTIYVQKNLACLTSSLSCALKTEISEANNVYDEIFLNVSLTKSAYDTFYSTVI